MLIRMAVADCNEEYVKRLLSGLEECEELYVSVYTDKQALDSALAGKRFDIVLLAPELYDVQLMRKNTGIVILLLDEAEKLPENCREIAKINKYQRISKLYQQILEFYSKVRGDTENVLGQKSANVIAFYSPIGGTGKTTLSLAAATRLAAQGMKTCYINLEDIAAEDCYLPQNGEKGLSELAVSLGSEIQFTYKIQSLLQKKTDTLFYINHFDSPNDINEMTGEETFELLKKISCAGLFDYVIVDVGVALNEKLIHIFEASARIVLVERPGAVAAKKIERFFEQSHIVKEYENKIVRLLNMDNGADLAGRISYIGRIGFVQNMDTEQMIAVLAAGSGSNFVTYLM